MSLFPRYGPHIFDGQLMACSGANSPNDPAKTTWAAEMIDDFHRLLSETSTVFIRDRPENGGRL